ncbi:hypothetical protein [Holophaga foetida]|uniref:hypothetical protein n=1 Tax=Holophaga foetida TaxID=35839 RepID=UPI00024742A6|nr:hypothetical protein [Holophaga foetida]
MEIKFPDALYCQIMEDLQRPHPFALERIGFVMGRMGTSDGQARFIMLTRYLPMPDDHYLNDPKVGARLGPDAMAAAMQAVYQGRAAKEGIFHIHLHDRRGEPLMSATDRAEIPLLIPGFQAVGPNAAHGIIILSPNHGIGWVWPPRAGEPVQAETLSVIGTPVHVFMKGRVR